jgi:hypothetical protein
MSGTMTVERRGEIRDVVGRETGRSELHRHSCSALQEVGSLACGAEPALALLTISRKSLS